MLRFALGSLVVAFACTGPGAPADTETGSMSTTGDTGAAACAGEAIACHRESLLIEAEALAGGLDAPGRVILDLRGQAEYDAGHVPGARRFDGGLIRATVDGIPGQVADRAAVAAALGAVGVSAESEVIAYDDGDGLGAARLVWTLRYYGVGSSRALDGGWTGWSAGGWPQSAAAESPEAATLTLAEGDPRLRVDAAWIVARMAEPGLALVDARTVEEYDAGHLPGAVLVPWPENKGADDLFLADAPLRARYEAAGILEAETVVVYCQTGSRASVGWLGLALLDHPDVRLYDGSWAEWGSDPGLPKEP